MDGSATTTASPTTTTTTVPATTSSGKTSLTNTDSSPPKTSELDVKLTRAPYTWKQLTLDWVRHHPWWGRTLNQKCEHELLAYLLPFYPEPDATRRALVIDTDIGDGNHIHELFIENIETPTKDRPAPPVKDVVLIHGYAASLGLFLDNFDELSSVPGIRIHAIDLLGFGFSLRPPFPSLPLETVDQVNKVEDWFIDAIERWRQQRGISRFTLMGHSFGGYLLSCYALKYNQRQPSGESLLDKLVLISPVGVERLVVSIIPKDDEDTDINGTSTDDWLKRNTRKLRMIKYMWGRNWSPFLVIRHGLVALSKLVSLWTLWRFAHYYKDDPTKFNLMHNYIYRVFTAPGLGEYALTRTLAFGALAKLPLIDRVPRAFVNQKLPTMWLYGDRDWMNERAGEATVKRINQLAGNSTMAEYVVVPSAGHHVYLDNPKAFNLKVLDFIQQS